MKTERSRIVPASLAAKDHQARSGRFAPPLSARMATHSSRSRRPFVINAAALQRISSALTEIGPLRYRSACADGIERSFDSLDELLAYPNAPRVAMQSLTIEAKAPRSARAARITILTGRSGSIAIRATAAEGELTRLLPKLRDELVGTRPQYWILAEPRGRTMYLALGMMMLAILAGPVWTNWAAVMLLVRQPIACACAGLLVLSVGYVLGRLRDALFPRGIIVLGHAVESESRRAYIRTAVVLAALLGIASSLVASVILVLAA